MVILFDEFETDFTSLGLGILSDAISCTVSEEINDQFTLTLTYSVNGRNYDKLKQNRIIYAKPNPYDDMQPFRIHSISKPIKGIVTVSANHISYDMNGIPTKAIDSDSLAKTLDLVEHSAYIKHNFKFHTDFVSGKTFKTTQPYNMRALLMGDEEEAILGVYDAEAKFNKFDIFISKKRGRNRGAQVCYGYNMLDLKHESTTEKLYNGVFPYYHKETTTNETITEDSFKKAYIVGSKPFQEDWLSYSVNGEPFKPLTDTAPVQIATEGDYLDKVYVWDSQYLKYVEKIYNQTVTLIENVVAPSWISIDWKGFPNIVCRANAKGYFKLATDSSWGDIKGVGDSIFEGNVLKEGLSGLTSNMIIYYSEVIPSGSESTNREVKQVTEVILDDPIIMLNTSDAKAMTHDNILSLNLSSEFNEEPSKEQLKAKAEEFIAKNELGTLRHTTEVSFLDLKNTTESDKYKNFEHVELGDTVRVIYKDLGVDVELRVISTEYDALNDIYTNVELGTKEDKMSTKSIQNGDNISSLTNDASYADVTVVNKLIADTVTAEYINATNAKLSKAQIEQLSVEKIECRGIIEASQFYLDEIVAKLLVAENAKITQCLEAGEIKVAGDITINSGAISIVGDNGTSFLVDRYGNVTANSVNITGGNLNINDGVFEVQNDGTMTAIRGVIAGFEITEEAIKKGILGLDDSVLVGTGISETASIAGSEARNDWVFAAGNSFGVTKDGSMYLAQGTIGGSTTISGGTIAGIGISNDSMSYYSGPTPVVNINTNWSDSNPLGSNLYAATYRFGYESDGYEGYYTGFLNSRYFIIRHLENDQETYYDKYMPINKLSELNVISGVDRYDNKHPSFTERPYLCYNRVHVGYYETGIGDVGNNTITINAGLFGFRKIMSAMVGYGYNTKSSSVIDETTYYDMPLICKWTNETTSEGEPIGATLIIRTPYNIPNPTQNTIAITYVIYGYGN